MNLQLFENPFQHHINLSECLELNVTTHPPRIFIRDEFPAVPKTPLPADFLCVGILYGVEGKTPGRAITSRMYSETEFTEFPISIFEHSFEVPPLTMRHYEMPMITALDFFRRGKYEIGVCTYLICYKGGEFWLFRLNPFYSRMFAKFLESNWNENVLDFEPFIFNLSAVQLEQKDINGQFLWEFEFKHREMIESVRSDATENEVYRLYLSPLLD